MGYKFLITQDGSVGLYDEEVKDIYHSASGAYKEAVDKFVIPSQLKRFENKICNVLDICYGVGYNTKALLNYSIKNNFNIEFNIDALEINKDLINISPFMKNKNFDIVNYEVDYFLLKSIFENNIIDFEYIKSVVNKNLNYLSINKPNFYPFLQNHGYKYEVIEKLKANLHNIYYQYKSFRHKFDQKSPLNNKNAIKWHIGDARKTILTLNKKYDIIFHDGFTAAIQPTLWTKEFLSIVCNLLNKQTGVILSYSSASPFRKVLSDEGMYVGKFYDVNINSTLASYNKNLIKYNLDEFELNLLNTNAGLPYEDVSLTSTCEEILKQRNLKLKNSKLESTSMYYKRNGKKHGTN